jgi:hypothetical protein
MSARVIAWAIAGIAAGVGAAHLGGGEAMSAFRSRTTWEAWLAGLLAVTAMTASVAAMASWLGRARAPGGAAARRAGSLVFVFAIAFGYAAFSWDYLAQASPVEAATGDDVLQFAGGTARFPHTDHMARLGDQCITCHHASLPGETTSACTRCHADRHLPTTIFRHDRHAAALDGKGSCRHCHPDGQPHAAPIRLACLECHATGAGPSPWAPRYDSTSAPALRQAAHRVCVGCHEREAAARGTSGAHLPQCATCHPAQSTGSARP